MNKELTPLQAYKRFAGNIRWLQENTSLDGYLLNKQLHLKEDLDTIEIELKNAEKNKKALEIIKKIVVVAELPNLLKTLYDYGKLTKEEYDLLKEILK